MKRVALTLLFLLLPVQAHAQAFQSYNVAGADSGPQWQGFSPSWVPGIQSWLRADTGVTVAAGPVTATGTTPPTVTLSGTPTAAQTISTTPYVELDCTTLGAITVSKFTLKLNGATVATNVASAASNVSIPGSGLTAGWAVGASATDDVYTANEVASTWTDSAGTAFTNATASKQPIYIASDSGYGGFGTLVLASAASQYLNNGSFPALNTPLMLFAVGESTSGAGAQDFQGQPPTIYWAGTTWNIYNGAVVAGSNTSRSKQAFIGNIGNPGALYIGNYGVANVTGNTGTGGFSGGMSVGSFNTNTQPLNGKIAELVVATGQAQPDIRWRLMTYASNRVGTVSQ